MTGIAGLRESPADVVRIRGALKVFQVARHASCACQVVVVVDVAIGTRAWRNRMCTRKHEVDHRVIKRCRRPGNYGMALRAVRRKVGCDVIGIGCALKILQVTSNASGATKAVVVADVAINALPRRHRMSAGQGESD